MSSSASRKARRANRALEEKPLRPVGSVRARFAYAGEVKGEWVRLADAIECNMFPAGDREVIRVEFEVVGEERM